MNKKLQREKCTLYQKQIKGAVPKSNLTAVQKQLVFLMF